jgi:ATP-dependent helicase HrpB
LKSYPIDPVLPELKEAVRKNPAVVLQAPPGSGKTTRAPLALLEDIPPGKRILMLEPRRIAAVSAARWMARSLGEHAGETVGYSIRFESRVSAKTRIEAATEGILLRRFQVDPGLEDIAMVIFDEFHERSMNADLALALCLDIRRGLREDLKIMVMSATLDCGPVASLLGGAPVVSAGGEAFPVEERYLSDDQNHPLEEFIRRAVAAALRDASGDILVFLPGAGEMRACGELLRQLPASRQGSISIHLLYGDLPFEEQERAILPSEKRKIVLATNIAETSLTIQGVRTVIDSGLTRRLQYDPGSGMNRLITVPVSRASAEQRKGRAGRLGPGVCYRLYSRHTFESLTAFAPPEILISDLSPLALELAIWGVKDPADLSWMDEPPGAAWETARRLLVDLGALGSEGSVTPAGRFMARLPLHPRLARLVHRAVELGCPSYGADLAALLSERGILRRGQSGEETPSGGGWISGRMEILQRWRNSKEQSGSGDRWALEAADRASRQILGLVGGPGARCSEKPGLLVPRLLLSAFPERIAKRREEGKDRFVLAQGRGVKLPAATGLGNTPFIIAVRVDAGEKAEGRIHLAEPISEDVIRREMSRRIETRRRLEWDKQLGRILSAREERLGSVLLSSRPVPASDDEAAPLVCEAIRSGSAAVPWSNEARQFQGRVSLMSRTFPGERWPDLSEERLLSAPEEWLLPWLKGVRTREQLAGVDVLPALRARLSREELPRLDERAPAAIIVPSGRRVPLDYASGEVPVLAVKLQEMFGLADTPEVAGGRVRVLVHLLSPAGRPVQVTRDLKGFWDTGYRQVKKDLKGRYPRHPWPDDPWNAVPTRKTKPRER